MKEFIVRWMMQIFKQDFQYKEYDKKKCMLMVTFVKLIGIKIYNHYTVN